MLDGLFGRGFAGKCKSLIKLTKSRIDVIRRKRNATQKFLKKDIADLLANGLDVNAYRRAEGFMVELILSSCYDFIEKCCDVVLKHLSIMQKMRECPEDCKEAVSCMMFAAARFSDLPELRKLRDMFHERYGNSLELTVNQQFVNNLASPTTTTEKKTKLMQDIASELSIKWNSKDFEQRMVKLAVVPQDQPKNYGPFHVKNEKYESNYRKLTNQPGEKTNVSSKGKLEMGNGEHQLQNTKEENCGATKTNMVVLHRRKEIPIEEYNPHNPREETLGRQENHDGLRRGKQEVAAANHGPLNGNENMVSKTAKLSSSYEKSVEQFDGRARDSRANGSRRIYILDSSFEGKADLSPSYSRSEVNILGKQHFAGYGHGDQSYSTANSTRRVQVVDTPAFKSSYKNVLPPPYIKSNNKAKDSITGASLGSSHSDLNSSRVPRDSSTHDGGASIVNRADRNQEELNHSHRKKQPVASPSRNGIDYENGHAYRDDVTNPIPKPRSSRRRHKSQMSQDDNDNGEDTGGLRTKSRSGRDDSRWGLQLLFDDEKDQNEEDERMIDKLLMHYSKKPSSYEQGKARRRSRSHHRLNLEGHAGETLHNGKGGGSDETRETVPYPVRSVSLPNEQTAPSDPPKVFARAASFQSDRSSTARHVHPKLPDYDDLAARFAALKGR